MIGKEITTELRVLVQLALPIMVTQLSQMGMGVADTVMAGRVSAVDLAGVALGGNLYWPLLMFLSGVIMSISPSVAQLHGAKHSHNAGEVVRQALWIALVGGGVLMIFLIRAEPVYRWIGVDAQAIPISAAYLRALAWGVWPMLTYSALRYLCDGLSWTRPAMIIVFVGLALKIPLNYGFIYGVEIFGVQIPAMGGEGCGWASALVMWYQALAMALVVGFSRMRVAGLFDRFSWPDFPEIWRLILLGVPIGLGIFLEFSMFSAVTLMIGRFGVDAVAAHQIATNLAGLAFMVPLALAMAASIRVGFNVGAKNLHLARVSGWTAIILSMMFALTAAVGIGLSRHWIPPLYSTDPAVIALASTLLVFVAFFQFFDDLQGTAIGALRGYKDTRTPMWVGFFAYWLVGFPLGIVLSFGWLGLPKMGVFGFWWGLSTGLFVAACILVTRFHWLSRNPSRVAALAKH